MPISVHHVDPLKDSSIKADVIVNAANANVSMGRTGCGGISGEIHKSYGSLALAKAMEEAAKQRALIQPKFLITKRGKSLHIPVGGVVTTSTKKAPKGSPLKRFRHIIHGVGPDFNQPLQSRTGEQYIAQVYKGIFEEAKKCGAKSLCIPVISSGIFSGGFSHKRLAQITAEAIHPYGKDFDITIFAADPYNPSEEPGILPLIRKELEKLDQSVSSPQKRTKKRRTKAEDPAENISPTLPAIDPGSPWLSTDQLSALLDEKFRSDPNVLLGQADSEGIRWSPKSVVTWPNAKHVIAVNGVALENVVNSLGRQLQFLRNACERDSGLNMEELSLAVPVLIQGNHWVLVFLSPKLENGQISYDMIFVDSQHDSRQNAQRSEYGIWIANSLGDNGITISTLDDRSCAQQKEGDGWSCGYHVVRNVERLAKGEELERNPNTSNFVAEANTSLEYFRTQLSLASGNAEAEAEAAATARAIAAVERFKAKDATPTAEPAPTPTAEPAPAPAAEPAPAPADEPSVVPEPADEAAALAAAEAAALADDDEPVVVPEPAPAPDDEPVVVPRPASAALADDDEPIVVPEPAPAPDDEPVVVPRPAAEAAALADDDEAAALADDDEAAALADDDEAAALADDDEAAALADDDEAAALADDDEPIVVPEPAPAPDDEPVVVPRPASAALADDDDEPIVVPEPAPAPDDEPIVVPEPAPAPDDEPVIVPRPASAALADDDEPVVVPRPAPAPAAPPATSAPEILAPTTAPTSTVAKRTQPSVPPQEQKPSLPAVSPAVSPKPAPPSSTPSIPVAIGVAVIGLLVGGLIGAAILLGAYLATKALQKLASTQLTSSSATKQLPSPLSKG